MDTIQKLNKAKTSLKGNITRIETFVDKVSTDTNITELEVKLKKLDQLQLKVEELKQYSFCIEKVSAAELTDFQNDIEECEQHLEDLEVRIKLSINSNQKCVPVIDVDEKETVHVKTKIPPVILPKFTGKYEHFSAFKNQFNDLITSNDQLTQSQKLYYLNSCLVDDVKEFASTFDSFASLYEALESRYDNKRLIVDVHIQSILNFKIIERENAQDIRAMIDCIKKNLRALKMLKYEQNELFNIFLLNIMLKKLDKESRKNFELFQKTKEVPSFDQFMTFLEQRESVLLSIDKNCFPEGKTIIKKPSFTPKSKALLVNENDKNKRCVICSEKNPHPVFRCAKFLQFTPEKRLDLVKLHKLCELCLRKNHKKNECFSNYVCTCGGKHSKSLCFRLTGANEKASGENKQHSSAIPSSEMKNQNKSASTVINSALDNTVLTSMSNQNKKSVLLSTGNIWLQNKNGTLIKCRCIFDSASNVNILSKKMSDFLGIRLEKIQTSVSGLNSTKQNIKGKLTTFISNENNSFVEPIEFLVTDKITGVTPSVNLEISEINIPKFLELADPCFFESKEIHALLNADIFCRIMKDNLYKVNEELLFRETEFGWVAGGRLNEIKTNDVGSCFLLKDDSSVEDTLKLFFELESLGIKDDPCFREDDQAMAIFKQTVQYSNGRYTVGLPFRKDWKLLSDNLPVAKQRFNNLWRRFQRNSELYSQYVEIIQDYINQGIVEKVENSEINKDKPTYYLPHQAIKKEGRVTTATRIVFDAASHQTNELSLNDCLWQGPNLYPNILDVLINFRLNRIAIASDIRQAFLQICLADNHKDAVRFLWTDSNPRIDKKPNLQVFRFNRVLFGVNASPFLLAATVKHHIDKYRDKFYTTVQHLDSFMYVDDWITGQDTREEALFISRSAKNIMKEAGMEMRKWISNDTLLMSQWASEGFETYPTENSVSLGTSKTKVLGMAWQTQNDCLAVDTKGLLEFIYDNESTKRSLLQTIGKIYDPLGLLTPFTIRMKCLIQELWAKKITWDENLPPKIKEKWLVWSKELPLLDELRIPRLVLDSTSDENDTIEIHTFCDASKLAYGAAVYIKVKKQSKVIVNLVTSKSRVAPLKSVTLPRLELLGALVAARLSSKVQEIIGQRKQCTVFHWTDSKIVLFWIKGTKTRWKQFVANRVKEIVSLTDPNSWYHCAGKDNPADLLSRGTSADCLVTNSKWWTGAEFLMEPEFSKNLQLVVPEVESLAECEREPYLREIKNAHEKGNSIETVLLTDDSCLVIEALLEHYNNYYKIIHVLSYIFRFIFNCRNNIKRNGPLTLDETREAEIMITKHAQRFLHDKKGLPSNISNLFPFVDERGIIRVGGRLENASVPYSQKHPPILPKGSKVSKIYFDTLHRRLFHVGPQGLLNAVRLKFWPLSGRDLARKTVHQCATCFKSKPILSTQLMGNLPSGRVNVSAPFSITGLDLCGPYFVKYKNQRKGALNKLYICVCICFSTKAIHLEQLSDLTSDALIATLKRFTSRRGRCSKVYTDNATNFVGANSNLKKFYKLINFPDGNLANYFTSENIDWNFIPPRSPHFGGLWEAGVKSVKHHLKRTIGDFHFTYEEFETIIIQIEGILNSRPLTPLSSDSDNFDVLTPGHFLIGRVITAIPEPSLIDLKENRLSRWQKTTKVVQLIWKKWKSDYLNTLQSRSKWMTEKNDVMIGQMVLVKEDFLPINKWMLGRIIAVYSGSDGKVRVVKVRTKTGEVKRAISKIAVLPIET